MREHLCFFVVAVLSVAFMLTSNPSQAQFSGLKDKMKEKAKKKTEEMVDKKTSDTTETQESMEQEEQPEEAAQGGTAVAEDMALYTKYDFVPGDKVIFYDHLAGEEIGEFPSRWRLDRGVFEVVRQGGENYIMCTDKGSIRPKMATAPLPPKYTVEMEFYSQGPEHSGHWFFIDWMDSNDEAIGEFRMKDNRATQLTIMGNPLADKELAKELAAGKHTMRIMATKSTIKCYIDHERVANVPAVEGFEPVGFAVLMDPWLDEPDNPMLMGTFRYAEGGKSLQEQLDETGRIITHGILFDSGSDRIKAESYKTLADIGQLLAENSQLRLSVEGHTDSDGAEDFNLTLSQKRAVSVKAYLMDSYQIDGARLETKGWGESKPIDTNDTTEGKANNRRVELVKL